MVDTRSQRLVNLLTTGAILLLLGAALLGVGWVLGGSFGALVTAAFAVGLVALAPRPSAERLLRAQGSRPLHPAEVPGLHAAVDVVAARAGVAAPRLFLIPADAPQALTTDGPDGAVIGVTPRLLRLLGPRQTVAVLAHEIAHLKNGDLTLLRLAETVHAVTRSAAQLSTLVLLFGVPLLLVAGASVPWTPLAVLLVAPWAVRMLAAALSRAREHDADATAAELTSDPLALASALERIERAATPPWWLFWAPLEVPSALRSHPPTAERVARLLDIERRRAF